jgi:hypothetical protein
MRRQAVAGFVLVLVGFVLYAQSGAQEPFVVQYIDGAVQAQLKGQTSRRSLKVMDRVPGDATVKLPKGATIELACGKFVIAVVGEGTYTISGLLSRFERLGLEAGSTVAQKIKAVAREPARINMRPDWSEGGYTYQQMQVDEREKVGQITQGYNPREGFQIDNLRFFHWGLKGGYAQLDVPRIYEEYQDAIDRGIRSLIRARYNEAIEHLRNAVDDAIFPDEVLRSKYLLAVAYAEYGSPVRAWKTISGLTGTKKDLEYGDLLVRKAQIQMDTFQCEDALATISPLLEPLAKDEFGQAACLVAYYAYRGLNRNKEASEMRQKALSIAFPAARAESVR